MYEHCSPRAVAPEQSVIPRPSPGMMAMLQNSNRNSVQFLQAAGIDQRSKEHIDLMTTIRALHRQYLQPSKYVEEQAQDRVDQLIAKARISLPWLDKYEDGWPARVYLKRYVDAKRPYLKHVRCAPRKQMSVQKSNTLHKVSPHSTEDLQDPNGVLAEGFTVKTFLSSLTPSLEHHVNTFAELGIRDYDTLRAFLYWPEVTQAEFLDENRGVLQLTSIERKGLLVGCGLLTQMALQSSLARIGNHTTFIHE